MAAGTKKDGELIDIKVAFCRGPHTSACRSQGHNTDMGVCSKKASQAMLFPPQKNLDVTYNCSLT